MGIKNPSALLTQMAELPANVEAKLPKGAPKISDAMVDLAGKLSNAPDFPMELPDLPDAPELPDFRKPPGANGGTTVAARAKRKAGNPVTETQYVSSPAAGVIPEVITRRGM